MLPTFEMPSLLEQAGFRIRGKRADCVHCEGSSRGTVSFTDELAFCHRCKWTANTFILARQLGLLRGNPRMREKFARKSEPGIVREAQRHIADLRSRLTPMDRERPVTLIKTDKKNLDTAIARALALAVEGELVQVVLESEGQ